MRRFSVLCLGLVGVLSGFVAVAPGTEAQFLAAGSLEWLIRYRLSTLNARVGVSAQHVPPCRQVAVNADEPMNTASVWD
jgi:hypothetical protein